MNPIVIDVAPHRLKMSYDQYLEFADDSRIVEWTDGEVICYMPPITEHQDISRFLIVLLDSFIQFFRLGVLHHAPLEVKLWPNGPAREPDILFISNRNLSNLTDQRYEGGPDLIIEIISPGSVTEDRVRKFTQYEEAGVQEYWIIDPRPRQQQADFFILDTEGRYQPAPLGAEGQYFSSVIRDFWFNVDWLWLNPLPNPQLALAEIMISLDHLPGEVKAPYQALYNLLNAKS